MAGVTVASVIVLFFLPLCVIGKAVGVGQPVTDVVRQMVPQRVGQPYYEYLQFVLQGTTTVNPSNPDLSHYPPFTIHGLWPSNFSRFRDPIPYVQNCNPNRKYNPKLGQLGNDLKNDLRQFWPDVERLNNLRFWTHEYRQHGSCANLVFESREGNLVLEKREAYFRTADYLYHHRIPNLYDLFNNIRIPRGRWSGTVNTTTYMFEIRDANGGFPRLRCNGTNNHFLREVVICYDKDAINVIDCPFLGWNCPKFISFPI